MSQRSSVCSWIYSPLMYRSTIYHLSSTTSTFRAVAIRCLPFRHRKMIDASNLSSEKSDCCTRLALISADLPRVFSRTSSSIVAATRCSSSKRWQPSSRKISIKRSTFLKSKCEDSSLRTSSTSSSKLRCLSWIFALPRKLDCFSFKRRTSAFDYVNVIVVIFRDCIVHDVLTTKYVFCSSVFTLLPSCDCAPPPLLFFVTLKFRLMIFIKTSTERAYALHHSASWILASM